jgi:hypothetical protein
MKAKMTFSLYTCGYKKGAIIIGEEKIFKRRAEYYNELLDLRESAVGHKKTQSRYQQLKRQK